MLIPTTDEELEKVAVHLGCNVTVAFYGRYGRSDDFMECAIECLDCGMTLVSLNTEVEEE